MNLIATPEKELHYPNTELLPTIETPHHPTEPASLLLNNRTGARVKSDLRLSENVCRYKRPLIGYKRRINERSRAHFHGSIISPGQKSPDNCKPLDSSTLALSAIFHHRWDKVKREK